MNRMAVDKPNTDTVYQTWLVVAYQLDASKSRAVGPVPGSKQQAKRRKEPGTIDCFCASVRFDNLHAKLH